MKNKKNDFELVKDHLRYINNHSWKIKNLDTIHIPAESKSGNEWIIGKSIFLDDFSFEKKIEKILEEESYFIVFNDGGLIHIAYSFDSNGMIKRHTLFFVNIYNSSSYIRLDYSSIEEKHSKSHMHTSLKPSKDLFEFRIPINSPVYPRTFLLFVLTNYYNFDCKGIDSFKSITQNPLSIIDKIDFPHLKMY